MVSVPVRIAQVHPLRPSLKRTQLRFGPVCRQYFSVKTGAAKHRSKISLQKWVFVIHLLSTSLKGVSSMKLHHDLGLTQRTAWLMAQKIRQGWIDTAGKLEGEVELDETSIGGKEKNRHETVNHSVGEYVRDRAHTNGIESFWAMLKRGYQGNYDRMRGRNLRRYVTEFVVPVLVAGELEASI